jgi:hypothetical protein
MSEAMKEQDRAGLPVRVSMQKGRLKAPPAYKNSGVEWLGGDSGALGGKEVAILLSFTSPIRPLHFLVFLLIPCCPPTPDS